MGIRIRVVKIPNSKNKKLISCFLFEYYKQLENIMKILLLCINNKKYYFLVKIFSTKCIAIKLYQIFKKLYFFINQNNLF